VVIAEDDTFFDHKGVNYQAVWDALRHDLKKKRFARGGSTITQQMIKNVLLSKEKTISRKLREFVLAGKAEELLTKRQILEIYLNEVEWGDDIHGIEAASRFYFDKHTSELSAAEAALLAGMLPNPRYYNPFKRPDKARQRQEQVLFNMAQAKLLTEETYSAALAEPLMLKPASSVKFDLSVLAGKGMRPCYQKVVEELLLTWYDELSLYRKGLRIRTSLDKDLQDRLKQLDGPDPVSDAPEKVTVVREGKEIRAFLCSQNRQDAAFAAAVPPGYEAADVALDDISQAELVLPERGGKDGTKDGGQPAPEMQRSGEVK